MAWLARVVGHQVMKRKPMYALRHSWIPGPLRALMARFACWRWKHLWKFNHGDPVCARCGVYRRNDKRSKARRKKRL